MNGAMLCKLANDENTYFSNFSVLNKMNYFYYSNSFAALNDVNLVTKFLFLFCFFLKKKTIVNNYY